MENYIESLLKTIESLGQANWLDYLQVIASIVSIIISALTVVMAVKIPKKIAAKQDKIALFNKRFSSYSILQKYVLFASVIGKFQNSMESKIYMDMFRMIFFDGNIKIGESKNEIVELMNISIPLKHMPFLFNNISISEIDEMIGTLTDLLLTITGNLKIGEPKQRYIETVKKFNDIHNSHILDLLKTE